MSKVLVIRLSAIGDVAMTIPIIYSVAAANPQDSFTVLTQTFLMPLFIHHPPNLNVMGVDTKTTEKSFFGFLRYAMMLRKYKFDKVIDLHNVIRSRMVDFIFRFNRKKVFVMDKNRKERRQITSLPPKEIYPLLPVTERYAEVFRMAGFQFEETFTSIYAHHPVDETVIEKMVGIKTGRWIGIAPFARHEGKIYPPEKMEQIVSALSEQEDVSVFLFGGYGKEEKILSQWAGKYKKTTSVAGRYLLDKELALISKLDVLVSMDSANMHFASLVGTKVISIWGATHPYAGFYGYHQQEELAVQVDLPCRPCSIYGNKPCYRKDWACMQEITPQQVLHKINSYPKEV